MCGGGGHGLKYAGVAYLLYLAWTTIRDKSVLTVEEETAHPSAARVITSGVLINILDPKLTIFFAFVVKLGRVSRRVAPAGCPGVSETVRVSEAPTLG